MSEIIYYCIVLLVTYLEVQKPLASEYQTRFIVSSLWRWEITYIINKAGTKLSCIKQFMLGREGEVALSKEVLCCLTWYLVTGCIVILFTHEGISGIAL